MLQLPPPPNPVALFYEGNTQLTIARVSAQSFEVDELDAVVVVTCQVRFSIVHQKIGKGLSCVNFNLPAGALPAALLSREGAAICWGDEKIHWNFQAFILCKATTRTTKKYDPSLDSLCKDTSLKAIDF